MKIFVSGRICLFGEHSDWAGGYRRTNGEIEKGYTIIAGTNQGIYAEVKPHPSKLVLCSALNDGTREGPFAVPMEGEALLAEARKGALVAVSAVLISAFLLSGVRALRSDAAGEMETRSAVNRSVAEVAKWCTDHFANRVSPVT